jgi:hypothetical protein
MHSPDPPPGRSPGPAPRAPAGNGAQAANPFAPPRAPLLGAQDQAAGFGAWRLAALAASGLVLGLSAWLLAAVAEPFFWPPRADSMIGLHQVFLFGLVPLSMLYGVLSLVLWRRVPALWKVAQVAGALLAVFGLVLLLLLVAMAWPGGLLQVSLALLGGTLATAPHMLLCLAALAEEKAGRWAASKAAE